MKIQETENFLIFSEVNKVTLQYFKDFPFTLWFLEGTASDGLFKQTFAGTDMDLSDYNLENDDDDDLELDFTLYYWKK